MAGQRLSCKRTQHNESRAREREGHGEVKMRAGGVKDEPEADWLRTGVVCHVWMWTLLLTSTYLHLPAVHLRRYRTGAMLRAASCTTTRPTHAKRPVHKSHLRKRGKMKLLWATSFISVRSPTRTPRVGAPYRTCG